MGGERSKDADFVEGEFNEVVAAGTADVMPGGEIVGCVADFPSPGMGKPKDDETREEVPGLPMGRDEVDAVHDEAAAAETGDDDDGDGDNKDGDCDEGDDDDTDDENASVSVELISGASQ
jgi:hypothetical protein